MLFPGHLELYLRDVDKTVEAKRDMENIELVCDTEFNGSILLKNIHLLVISEFRFIIFHLM